MVFPNILKSTKWLDLSTSAKLVIIWIILESYYVIDLILDSSLIILAFYQRMNKPNIHNNIIGCISSFQNGFSDLSSTGFFSKYTFLRLQHFFSLSGYPINSVPVHINKIHAFDKAFILLISECLWISNFSRLWHVARSSRP